RSRQKGVSPPPQDRSCAVSMSSQLLSIGDWPYPNTPGLLCVLARRVGDSPKARHAASTEACITLGSSRPPIGETRVSDFRVVSDAPLNQFGHQCVASSLLLAFFTVALPLPASVRLLTARRA